MATSDAGGMTPQRRVAILHQAAPPPPVNGIYKPMKPGGYQDAGADMAYTLAQAPTSHNITVITPSTPSPFTTASSASLPSPDQASGWTFPDTPDGILSALERGTTHIWANTILFASHPLQTSPLLTPYLDSIHVIGQPPLLVEVGDDKEFVNDVLRSKGCFTLPSAWGVTSVEDIVKLETEGGGWTYPVVAKPIRGRGSFGVKVCGTGEELREHVAGLLKDSSRVMIEEFLSGQEATVTVMPPTSSTFSSTDYYALPPVIRTNHHAGVAPWNGIVAVSANSRVVTPQELEHDGAWKEIMRECEGVARLLSATAAVRIDVRRFGGTGEKKDQFALFDVNMKPNMTGPGRPGRENQTNLCGIAASGLGWDFERLLIEMLSSARTLRELRDMKPRLTLES